VFRLVAVFGIPLGLLLVTELVLRLAGYGYATGFFRRGQVQGAAVWMNNPDFGRRFFPPGLARSAEPFSIAAKKPADTLRIFVLGESAAMGDPDFKFGLPRMLEVLLRQRYPRRKFEVVNAAIVAINSNVILPLARDCAKRQGDLWVIYMGNNEVIGPFGSASVFGARAPPLGLVRTGLWLKTLRLGQLLSAGLRAVMPGGQPTREWGGMEMMAEQRVRQSAPENQRVYRHFERNLDDLLAVGARAGVRMVLCTVPTNLKDCAPFASLHRAGLSAAQLAQWQSAYDAGTAAQKAANWTAAKAAFERAGGIDDDFAELAFRQADCCRALGQAEAARYYQRARDLDALQFRADNQINTMVRRAGIDSRGGHLNLVDAEEFFRTNSPEGLVGREYFYEHVHLTPEGNYLLARAVAEAAGTALSLQPTGAWISQAECFHLLGLTDWNRNEAFDTILDRIQGAPFTNQIDHAAQVQYINQRLAEYRLATKPTQVRRQAAELGQRVDQDPEDADFRWNLAGLLEASGDLGGAEAQWRSLIRLQPQAPLPPYNLARLLENLGRSEEALALYRQSLRLDKNENPARSALSNLLWRANARGQSPPGNR
jgi:tetratricopeptide (TPR) repeat protein